MARVALEPCTGRKLVDGKMFKLVRMRRKSEKFGCRTCELRCPHPRYPTSVLCDEDCQVELPEDWQKSCVDRNYRFFWKAV